MRALFLIPPVGYGPRDLPIDRVYGCNYGFDHKPPIHLLQLATYARDVLGWEVRLLDCVAEGLDVEAFEAWIASRHFDVSVHQTTYLSAIEDLAAAKRVQAAMPGIRQVFVGLASTWKPDEFLFHERAYCLLGEPELTLGALAEAWDEQLGVACLIEGQLVRGEMRPLLDVSALPMPDRTLLRGTYRANRLGAGRMTVLVVSRGCGFRCNFCTPNAVDQSIELEFKRTQTWYVERPPLRKRTVDQIVAEFEHIASLGYESVEIADNIFTWGKERTKEICRRIAPLGLKWICLARPNMLHDGEMVRAMRDAGCVLVYMGSESFDDALLTDMFKQSKVVDIQKAVQTCFDNGVEPEVSVLIGGSPNETWGTLYRSFRAARQLGTSFVHFSVALPSPSTELYDMAREGGWFVEGDFVPADNARDAIVNLPHLSALELRVALKLAYAAQYLAPSTVVRHVRRTRTRADLRHKLAAAQRLFGFLIEIRDQVPKRNVPPGRVTPLSDSGRQRA